MACRTTGDHRADSSSPPSGAESHQRTGRPGDEWMNDDDHRYGALRESYDFEYAVLEQADKNKNTNFEFETYDTFEWYLTLGPLTNINEKYLHGKIPYWNDSVAHPDYDEFWKKEAWVNQLHSSTVPTSTSPASGIRKTLGSLADFSVMLPNTIRTTPTSWSRDRGSTASGRLPRPTPSALFLLVVTKRRVNFAKISKRPFSATTFTASAKNRHGRPAHFRAVRNLHTYAAWLPRKPSLQKYIFHADGTLSLTAPDKTDKPFREYVFRSR